MSRKLIVFATLLSIVYMLSGFGSSSNHGNSEPDDAIHFQRPVNFPRPLQQFKVTRNGFELGKLLFYDPLLSVNGKVSCSNCHQPSAAFADLNSKVSSGINNCKGTRNAPPLMNLAWLKTYMWDGRINKLHEVPLDAISNSCEMGNTITEAVTRVKQSSIYPQKFNAAFGPVEISKDRILDALTQFMAMLVSADSRYDKVIRREKGYRFTEAEQQGFTLFESKCKPCHPAPLFTDQSFRNNGLEPKLMETGRAMFTHRQKDEGKFRVPSLRNVEITGPYMHDGRFGSLEEVLKHYASDLRHIDNIDPVFKKDFSLSPDEQTSIIAFLRTLTDVDFINDRRFNNN